MIAVDASAALIANERPATVEGGRPGPRSGYRYVGTYHCTQGETKLTVAIEEVGGGEDEVSVQARFEFLYEPDDDDSTIRGSYRMRGKYDVKMRRLVLKPVSWLEEPPGWQMVGILGTISKSGDTYSGTMDHAGCTTFDTKLDPATAGH